MAKKTLTTDDQDLFRQTIGKVRAINSDKILLNKENKPKPYPKPLTVDINSHLDENPVTDISKVGLEDAISFITPEYTR